MVKIFDRLFFPGQTTSGDISLELRKDTIMALQREWIDRTNQIRQALLKLRDSL